MVGNFASERVHVRGALDDRGREHASIPGHHRRPYGLQLSLDDRVAHRAAASEPEPYGDEYWEGVS
jgi:hypothetical protein